MATNYVLEEYCEGKPVTPTTRMEAEMGSGVTLYVGVEEGYGTTIVPRLVGCRGQGKGRLWELGLNVGAWTSTKGSPAQPEGHARLHPDAGRRAQRSAGIEGRPAADARREETRPLPGRGREAGGRRRRGTPWAEEQQRDDSLRPDGPGGGFGRNPPRSGPPTITRVFSTDDRHDNPPPHPSTNGSWTPFPADAGGR